MIAWAMSADFWGWLALAGGMTLSFLFSGVETGSYVVNKIRLDLRAESGHRSARTLRAIVRNPRELLTVVLLGNNLANYAASAGMVLILTHRGWDHPDLRAAAILTPVLFVLCETLPKNLFYRHGETLTYLFAGFLSACRWILRAVGLVGLVSGIVALIMRLARRRMGPSETPLGGAGRVAAILAEGRASGVLTHSQTIIAERVVNIARVRLSDVMVPLDRAILAGADVTREQLRDLLHQGAHVRVGIWQGERFNVTGVVNAFDALLNPTDRPVASFIQPALRLPDQTGVLEALSELRQRRQAIAFVTDPAGRCVGLVTVKDLVEEIVGELDEA